MPLNYFFEIQQRFPEKNTQKNWFFLDIANTRGSNTPEDNNPLASDEPKLSDL